MILKKLKKRLLILGILVALGFILTLPRAMAANLTSEYGAVKNADFYFLMDYDTKEILLQRNAETRIAPSSMTKIMTAYTVFDEVKKGNISMTNQCLIGKGAYKKRGSSMFLNYGDVVSIDELVQGLLAVSGNDASIALAESTAGSVDKFVALMNLKAKELNLKNSHFMNPHGLNEDGHYMSLHDLAVVISHIYQDFPQYSSYLSIPEFTYHNIKQENHNPLIQRNYDGLVGGKTGYTGDGGYGVVASVKRNSRRLIAVTNKCRNPRIRAKIITELFDYGFNEYKKLSIFEKGKSIAKLKTWMGKKNEIEVAPNQEIAFNVPVDKTIENVKVSVEYNGPIQAPIVKGQEIATLIVDVKDYKVLTFPIYANETIDKSSFLERITLILRYKVINFLKHFGL